LSKKRNRISWKKKVGALGGVTPEDWLKAREDEETPELAAQLSQILGHEVTTHVVSQKRYKLRSYGDPDKEDPVDESEDQAFSYLEQWKSHVGEKPGYEEILRMAGEMANAQNAYRPHYLRATRRIITSKPINVAFASDFHLGSPRTDYTAFLNTTQYIRDDPSFYLAIVGRDLETAFAWFRSAEAVVNQVLPPWLQVEAYRLWLKDVLHKTLCTCGDNHTDERLEAHLGDIGLMWREDIPYFRTQGILKLEVGPDESHLQEYLIILTHRYKGHSIYHGLQPALRMMRDIHPLGDLYVTAHTHKPWYMSGAFYPEARDAGKERQHFLVTGTFKVGSRDLYSQRNFGGSGVLGVPVVKFWPNEYRLQYYESPYMAIA